MKKIFLILSITILSLSLKAQNVVYLFGMNSNGQPVINSLQIPNIVNSGVWTDVLSKPTTLAGYGITDAASSSSLVKYYNHSGVIATPTKVWNDIIAVTSATQTIDISTAGFTSINSIVITASNNTSTVTAMPVPIIKTYSATSLVVNILVSGSTTVVVGGLVPGLTLPATFTGMALHIHVDGW